MKAMKRAMKKLNKGSLVFLPANVTLLQFSKGDESFSVANRHMETNKPFHALLLEEKFPYYKILYEGEYWFAKQGDLYTW